MKLLPELSALFLTLFALVFSGCEKKSSFNETGDTAGFVPAIGLEDDDVLFVNHALFAIVGDSETAIEDREIGFVGVSSSHLFLAEGRPPSFEHESVIKIPLNQLDSVANTGLFLQLRYNEKDIFVMPFRWFSDTTDFSKLEILTNMIAYSVPSIEPASKSGFVSRIRTCGIPPLPQIAFK